MDDPFSWPGPERSFPCPRSAVCIIVTNASRPDPPPLGFDQFLSVAAWTLPTSACPCIGSQARSGGISIVMTAPMIDYKIHWLKMMSVPESRAVVGRHDGINGRDSLRLEPSRSDQGARPIRPGQALRQAQEGHLASAPAKRLEANPQSVKSTDLYRPDRTFTRIPPAKDYNDALSGCRARAFPHNEDVSPKSFERGSVE